MFPTNDTSNGKTKYVGRAKAVVTDNRDPLYRGRIRVNHPLMGETAWIDYLRSPGMFDIPPIGSTVYVEADGGFYTHLIAHGNSTIGTDSNPNVPESFQSDIPTNHGLYTPNGHLLEMDDGIANFTTAPIDTDYTDQDRGIRITTKGGNKIHLMEDSISSKQYILIQDISGNSIKLDYGNNQLNIHSVNNTNQTVGGNLNITVTGIATIVAPKIILNSEGSGITTENSHMSVIDLITGVPVQPSTTVFSDI